MTGNPGAETRINYLRPGNLSGIEFLAAENDQGLWHVFHERYVICAGEVASVHYSYRGSTHTAHDRVAMLMEPGESHRNLAVPRPQSFRVLFMDPALLESAAKEHGMPATPHFAQALVADPRLLAAIYRLYDSVEAEDTILEQQSRLAFCLRLALAHIEQNVRVVEAGYNYSKIQRAKDHLRERFDKPVSLDDLATLTGLSPFHLVRSFTRHVGLPPHAYQIHVRVERARALLAAGAPLAEVASSVGFADQSHFTRHFRRINNVTPANYARAAR
jgi:AraC-like DNA-binding protein